MKSRRSIVAAVAATLAATVVVACSSSGATTKANPYHLITPGVLLASTSGASNPFTVQTNNTLSGFTIDLNNEVAKRLGLKPEYKIATSSAGLQGLTTKQYDMVANGLGVTADREKSVSFAKGEYWSTTSALTKTTSDVQSMTDLAGKKVAVITGNVQVDYLKQIKGAIAVDFSTQGNAISALNSGSVDAFLVGGPDGDAWVKQFPSLHVAASQPVDHATTVAFQKGNTALVDAYNEQLMAMVKDGTFKTIYQKYFSWPPAPELVKIWPGLA